MKEAMHYRKVKEGIVQCQLCPRYCTLKEGERGECKVRENKAGKMYSLVYARPCAVNIDNIEKKPLYHFLPGSKSFSVGTAGCNLHCVFCQNFGTAQRGPEEVSARVMEPGQVVKNALKSKCQSISYTYNEGTVFYEYALDTAKLARKNKLRNVVVTNGYINEKPLEELYKHVDAANVDLKGFSDGFYKEMCDARLKPVLNSLKLIKKMGVWLEVTNLVIPGFNDDMKKIKNMCSWIKSSLGPDVPLHFSRFFPCYKMMDVPITPFETLRNAYEVARNAGIRFVYLGNIGYESGYSDTFCPKCGERLVKRGAYFGFEFSKLKNGRCFKCNERIPGVWK